LGRPLQLAPLRGPRRSPQSSVRRQMASRPARRAAQAAVRRIEDDERVVISSSDGEDEDDEGESQDEEESSEGDLGAAEELSAYEVQRLENIAKNQAVLDSLGLGGSSIVASASRRKHAAPSRSAAARGASSTPGSRKRSQQAPSEGPSASTAAARKRVSRSPSVASAHTDDDDDSEEDPEDDQKGGPSSSSQAHKRSTGRVAEARPPGADARPARIVGDDDVDAYFDLLCDGKSDVMRPHHIQAQARKLGLDMKAFTPEAVELMLECFDTGGKGGLLRHEFRRVCERA